MKPWTVVACVFTAAMLAMGCNPTSRYKVLSFVFDGVPDPEAPGAQPAVADAGPPGPARVYVHGPYGARLCNACHDPAAMNVLVTTGEPLCFRCHDIKMDKKYIHGPLASGGCTACHDPHSSKYRYLLVAEPERVCFYCHIPADVAKVGAHQGVDGQCTTCHDAHMSNQKYLLR